MIDPRPLFLMPIVLVVVLAAAALLPLPAAAAEEAAAAKVSLELYYESLCPYCSRFMVNRLAGIFEDGLIDAVDLRLVPYGNARVGSNGDISCQDVHFRFIYCVEDLVVKRQYKSWDSCFQKLGLDPKPVTECYKNEKGHKLELKYANQTDALVPPHRYVPWVVVDGQPLLEDYENFEAYICKAYKGTSPPKVCEGLVHPPMALETVAARNGVTYNSGGIKLATAEDERRDSKIKMRLPDDDN
ncbi:unnamed protein product [Urochloa decumbens]|uniref:Gamma-interferon-inducible lysosomal thiol reductase n=1 Tax=Urochloa decumbens TaxID=240449 RepID=A0ABC9HG66_9POAL